MKDTHYTRPRVNGNREPHILMKSTNLLLSCCAAALLLVPFDGTSQTAAGTGAGARPKRLLVVTVTKGFRHSSITVAERVLAELGTRSGDFSVDYARVEPKSPEFQNAEGKPDGDKVDEAIRAVLGQKMSREALQRYDGFIFANTTGILPLPDKQAFLEAIRGGKAFMGMHSATDTFHAETGIDPYIEMIGAEFRSHGAQVKVDCLNQDPEHPACKHLGPVWSVQDEIYLFKNFFRNRVHGLLTLDKEPNKGTPGDYPIAWCKQFGKGNVFYTSLGHREDVWESEVYQKHILGGIRWALGLEKGDATPQRTEARLSAEEGQAGFRPLFNGADLTGWRLRNPNGRASWSAQNGMLVNEITGTEHGTDLVSEDKFKDFTIRYDFIIPKGSNSGLYLRGRYEIQIADDFERNSASPGGNGALYNFKPVSVFASRPAGQWQTAEATIRGTRVSVTLNGQKVHEDIAIDRATGGELDQNLDQAGPILLQGDHGAIAFRNVRIKTLD